MMSEENLRASMNLWEKQERLHSVFDFMRRPCLVQELFIPLAKTRSSYVWKVAQALRVTGETFGRSLKPCE
jgi:hypothetical protein